MPPKTSSLFFQWSLQETSNSFVVYADFECLTKPINNCEPDSNYSFAMEYQKHEPSGFCLYLKRIGWNKNLFEFARKQSTIQWHPGLMRGRRAYFSDNWLCCSSPKQYQYVSNRGPDDLPNWVLKKFSDIPAPALTEVLNQSFQESKVPRTWKLADVPPVPNGLYWRL